MRRFVFRFLVAWLAVLFAGQALASNEPTTQPKVRVGIVLFDGVEIIDFAGPYEVFGTAGLGVVTLSPDGKPVKTAMGLTVTPDASFADAPPIDVLLVPGGDVADAARDARVLGFIRQRSGDSRYVLSVCTGAFILGSAGVLDGLKATTFHPSIDALAKRFPKVQVIRDVRWADNGKVITSAGLSSGIDAALHVVAKLRGADAARSAAMILEYDWKSEGGFVRSRMADRYVPATRLQASVQWPKDMKFERVSGFGDETHWLSRYHVVSSTPAKDLIERVGRGLEHIGGWKRDGQTDRWTSEQQGHHVTLLLQSVPGASANAYDLVLTTDAAS